MTGPARFITLEGGEGAGKSTQIKRLAAFLTASGIPVMTTREPGGSVGAEAIRSLLVTGDAGRWDGLTEILLFMAARRDHLVKTIRPALAAGTWVISDRFQDSTVAYQCFGHGQDKGLVDRLYGVVVEDTTPDLTLILDLPPDVGVKRSARGGGQEDRFERLATDFHDRLRQGFLTIARAEPARCAVVDANADVDTVFARLQAVVAERLLSDGATP